MLRPAALLAIAGLALALTACGGSNPNDPTSGLIGASYPVCQTLGYALAGYLNTGNPTTDDLKWGDQRQQALSLSGQRRALFIRQAADQYIQYCDNQQAQATQQAQAQASANAVAAAYKTLGTSSAKFESAVQACSQLSCVTAQDRKEVTAIQAFASSVSSAGVTGPATADVTRLVNDANGAAESLGKLAASTSVAQYQSDASGSPLQQQLTSLDADYTKLVNDLRG